MTTSDNLQSDSVEPQEDPVLNDEENLPEEAEVVEEEKKRNPIMIAAMVIAAFVMVFALVVLFYASQYYGNGDSGEETPATTKAASQKKLPSGEGDSETSLNVDTGSIVEESEWHHYNGDLDENGNPIPGKKTTKPASATPVSNTKPTTAPSTGDEAPVSPASTAAKSFDPASLIGLDEDDAVAKAKKEGYVVYSVYVCDAAAVKNGSKAPKAGGVLGVTTYTMRQDGEKDLFLQVATSDSYKKAQTVPNVVGMQWKDARSKLAGVGIGTRYAYERNSKDAKGKVLFQAVAAGGYIPSGSTIVLVLAD